MGFAEACLPHPLRQGRDLFVGACRGLWFAHNPLGERAVRPLGAHDRALIEAADGRALQEILGALTLGSTEAAAPYLRALEPLLRGGYLRSPAVEPDPPASPPDRFFNTWIHLTNDCNLDCPYCYVAKSREHMGETVVERVLGAIATTAARGEVDRIHVRFAGGEPMLRFAELVRLYDDAKHRCTRHGVRFTAAVITNGASVPKGAVEWLAQEQVSVSLSIDGVGAVQDAMRPVRGGGASFHLVERSLDRYLDAGIRPYALVTVSRANLSALPELVSFLLSKQLGFRLSLVRDFEHGAADLREELGAGLSRAHASGGSRGLLRRELADALIGAFGEVYDRIEDVVAERARVGSAVVPSFQETHRFCDLELWRPIKKACGAAETYVAIGSDGEVSPCQGALRFPGTTPIDPSRTLPEHARGQRQLHPFLRSAGNETCNRCAFRHSCAGGCPLLLHRRDGHADGRSPYCEVFRAVIPRILGIAALERSGSLLHLGDRSASSWTARA